MKYAYGETVKILPMLVPQDIKATATVSQYLDMNLAAGLVEISIPFGNIASTDSTGGVQVTVTVNPVADTSSSDSVETAIAFEYRLSAAVDTDTMGALAAATSAGVQVGQGDDNKTLFVYVNPSDIPAQASTGRFIRAELTPTAEVTAILVGGITGRYIPRYAGASMPSST